MASVSPLYAPSAPTLPLATLFAAIPDLSDADLRTLSLEASRLACIPPVAITAANGSLRVPSTELVEMSLAGNSGRTTVEMHVAVASSDPVTASSLSDPSTSVGAGGLTPSLRSTLSEKWNYSVDNLVAVTRLSSSSR